MLINMNDCKSDKYAYVKTDPVPARERTQIKKSGNMGRTLLPSFLSETAADYKTPIRLV